ncbi:MAG TPA: hypothetical protein PKV52_04425, partial [Candidatus Saccharibacteria bacterium]|nr:hypothetical protein [Candidatus Saccharibacteria bacterium]
MYYLLKITLTKVAKRYITYEFDKYDTVLSASCYHENYQTGLFVYDNEVLTTLNQKPNLRNVLHSLYDVSFEQLTFSTIDISDYILDDLADILIEVLPLWDKRDEPIIILMGLDEETDCET